MPARAQPVQVGPGRRRRRLRDRGKTTVGESSEWGGLNDGRLESQAGRQAGRQAERETARESKFLTQNMFYCSLFESPMNPSKSSVQAF